MAKHYDANPVITVDEAGNYVAPGGGGGGSSNPNGQATMANSAPVVIASNQSAIPVSQSSQPLPTGASTSALQTTGNTSLGSIDTKLPTVGQKTAATSVPVVLASDQSTVTMVPATPNGTRITSAATTNGGVFKASAGVLYEVTLSNPTATPAYFKAYNKATTPTVGTDVPIFFLQVAANSTAVISWDGGKSFVSGISFALTGGIAVSDTTAAVAGILISASYI